MIRNYLDVCLEMPWNTETRERVSVEAARKVLEKDHFGLAKVKERILETIAVRQMNPKGKGQILCLVGRRGWENLHCHQRCQGAEPEAGPAFPGRRPGRGGHPGPPADLHRLHARPGH